MRRECHGVTLVDFGRCVRRVSRGDTCRLWRLQVAEGHSGSEACLMLSWWWRSEECRMAGIIVVRGVQDYEGLLKIATDQEAMGAEGSA